MHNNRQKFNELKELEDRVFNLTSEANYKHEWKLFSDHAVIWTGFNLNAPIIIAQMNPDRTEHRAAQKDRVHDDYVLYNPAGYMLRRTAQRAGFDVHWDFIYTNIIPWMRIGGLGYSAEIVKEMSWIFDSLKRIIKPKLIITLGFDAFKAVMKQEVDILDFEDYIQEGAIFETDKIMIVPLEDPAIIESDNSLRHKSFYETIRRLYVKTHNLREQNE